MVNLNEMKSLSLAYLGDAIYAAFVRKALLLKHPYLKPNDLHKRSNTYVNASFQSEVLLSLRREEFLTEEEWGIAKKARNQSSATRAKNATIQEYRNSSGLEALIGYLEVTDERVRMNEIMTEIIKRGEANE